MNLTAWMVPYMQIKKYITNGLQDRNHITTSRDAEEALKKIQYAFIIKTKNGETIYQHNKGYPWPTQSQRMLNGGKLH